MLSRRHLFGNLFAGAFGGLFAGGAGRLFAAPAAGERRLVVVVLRGALDGLAAVPPYFERDYRRWRGPLALAEPGAEGGVLDLDGRFALHPALAPLHDLYRGGEMIVVHAVATPDRSRSHFDAQDVLENGAAAARAARDGWLNRALGLLATPGDARLGLAVGQAVPLLLRGAVPVASWAPPEMPALADDFLTRLAALYQDDALLGPAIADGLKAQAMAEEALGDPRHGQGRMSGTQVYGRARGAQLLRTSAEAAGRLLAAPRGARIAVLELGGWDTHANQGALTGLLATRLGELVDGLVALRAALGPAWRETIVAVVTEFGRTVAVNGTNGTDHGTGGVAVLLGGAVAGGRVITRWPGLAATQLHEGRDLAPTTDLRSVMKTLLGEHLGIPRDAIERVVFPDSRDAPPLREMLRT